MSWERGYTILEVLVATLIVAVVMMGFGNFFVSSVRVGRDMDARTALQRQGTAIAEEFSRQLRRANNAVIERHEDDPLASNCAGTSVITNATVVGDKILFIERPGDAPGDPLIRLCFYRDRNAPGGPQIRRCSRPEASGDCEAVVNMLAGALAPLTATDWTVQELTPCDAAGGTCTGTVCSIPNQACGQSTLRAAKLEFKLDDGRNLPEAFGVAILTGQGSRH